MVANRESQNPVDLDDLYRDVILDHYRRPRNRGARDDATVSAEGFNPSCGDEIQLSVAVINGTVDGLGFGGSGCSISQSSASMMTEAMTGRTLESAREMSRHVQQMLTDDTFDLDVVDLGDLEALSGVAKFPVRIKCGLLPWKVLDQVLANAAGETVSDDSDIPTRVTSG